MTQNKIPEDRLVLGPLSAFRTLVPELSKKGAIDLSEFASILKETASTHREGGDPDNLANAIDAIAEQIAVSIIDPATRSH
jgi:hypothetical protein